MSTEDRSVENVAAYDNPVDDDGGRVPLFDLLRPEHWHEGGDGHGYGYQYIGPIHYLCECGRHFLNRDGWSTHRAGLGLPTATLPRCGCVTPSAETGATR